MAQTLLECFGGRLSAKLGIDLHSQRSDEVAKWFLASILLGARISEKIALKTYKEFERANLTSPRAIASASWDKLVEVLDAGGYVRYDFKTADKLLEVMNNILLLYGGNLNRLHDSASSPNDLEQRVKDLGKGIGDVTVSIFLRELRGIWQKANPRLSSLAVTAALNLGLIANSDPIKALSELESAWRKRKVGGWDFADFEAALLALAKNYCKKRKCATCPVRESCTARRAEA